MGEKKAKGKNDGTAAAKYLYSGTVSLRSRSGRFHQHCSFHLIRPVVSGRR